jgi:hypothetical protein
MLGVCLWDTLRLIGYGGLYIHPYDNGLKKTNSKGEKTADLDSHIDSFMGAGLGFYLNRGRKKSLSVDFVMGSASRGKRCLDPYGYEGEAWCGAELESASGTGYGGIMTVYFGRAKDGKMGSGPLLSLGIFHSDVFETVGMLNLGVGLF